MEGRWVQSWASVPQRAGPADLPPAPFTRDGRLLVDATLRQTIRASVGGPRLRLRLSNTFGGAALSVSAMTVARPVGGRAGVSAIQPGTARQVTFDGRTSVRVPARANLVGDPVELAVEPGTNLTVTMYLAGGLAASYMTGHPASRTTSYLATGDHVADADLPAAVPVDHWYLLSGLELWCSPATAAAVMVGDSLTDGRGSTTNGNDRWPDRLLDRLQADRDTAHVAVVNQAAGGNRVLDDGGGPGALRRVERDVLALSGVAWLLVFEGANDIGTAPATGAAQRAVAGDLISAYDRMIRQAHARGIRVYGATITPFGANTGYDDPAGIRAASRQAVNHWIRTGNRFDATIDFDRAVRDPDDGGRLWPGFDIGDHLHLNPTGYQALADAVPAHLFRLGRSAIVR
jgi:lysophospholipase L1-like esterase